jgi:alpha-tubulin suppressor-like RCC1 family protein
VEHTVRPDRFCHVHQYHRVAAGCYATLRVVDVDWGNLVTLSRGRLVRVLLATLLTAMLLPGTSTPATAAGSRVLSFADSNHYGQLGNGTADVGQSSPIELSGMSDIVDVAAGTYHSLALRSDGRVLAWGDNRSGQIGDGTTSERHEPTLVPGLTHVVAIEAGGYFSLAIRSDGSVWQWGQRGTEDPANWLPSLLTPTRVDGIFGIALGAGIGHRVIATADGNAVAFGYNGHGQLSDGTTIDRWPPAPMHGATGIVEVGAGYGHSVVRLEDGTVLTSGMNQHGQLGDGTTTPRSVFAPVPGLIVEEIAVGYAHTLGLLSDGTVVAWGQAIGLGNSNAGSPPDRPTPGPVPGLSGVTAISAGWQASAAITHDGVWTWGWSTGVEGHEIWGFPIFVEGTAGATNVAMGSNHGLFLIEGVPLDLPDPVATTMTVERETDPALVGEPVTFTVTIDPAPDMGSVEMGEDATGTTQTVAIDPETGQATFTDTFASAGDHTRYFRFDGVPGYEGSTAVIDLNVGRRATTVSIGGPATRTIGRTQALIIDAIVAPSTAGDAQVFDVTGSPVALGDPAPVDPAGGSVTLAVGPLAVGEHQLEVRYLGSASHLPSASSRLEVTVVEGPVAGVPTISLPNRKTGVGTLPVTIRWAPASDPVDHYELEERIDGGPWSAVSSAIATTSVVRTVAVGRSYEYRVRAVDADDHAGPWAVAAAFRARLTENTSGAIWYRGTWSSTVRSASYSGGSARPTTAKAAKATLTFTGSGVSWLATVGPNRGRVSVYVDGVFARTIDLRAGSVDTRRIVFSKSWATPGRHTITLSNLATSGRPRFDLDAIVTWTGP